MRQAFPCVSVCSYYYLSTKFNERGLSSEVEKREYKRKEDVFHCASDKDNNGAMAAVLPLQEQEE